MVRGYNEESQMTKAEYDENFGMQMEKEYQETLTQIDTRLKGD
jgi:hypothetical protein